MFFTKFASFFMTMIYSVSAFFSVIPATIWYGDKKYTVADPQSIVLEASFIGDTHAKASYFEEYTEILRKSFCGISRTDTLPDAVIITGDVTNAASEKEYKSLKYTLKSFNKVETVIPATGNHDIRGRDTFEESAQNFYNFADFCGIKTDKTYFTTSVKGFSFIIIGSEKQRRLDAVISDEQLSWFDAQMAQAVKTQKPIFIVCHQPLYNSNETYFDPEAEKNHGVGDQSEQIADILRKYVPSYQYPVFFISGHLHRSFDERAFDFTFMDNLYCVNIPSITKTENGGDGLSVEVYPDKVLLRARNYIKMEWLPDYQYEIQIN